MIDASGFYPDLDAEAYFADPCPTPSLRQSLIPDLVNKSPYHAAFRSPRLNPYGSNDGGDKARWLGSAVHRLALGRGREISAIRYPDFKSSSAQEARRLALANNRIPVLERELVAARDMAEIVKEAIHDALGGAPYETEVPFFWQETCAYGEIWCGGMLDVWAPSIATALDVKALRSAATPAAFGRTSGDNGYDIQDVFYTRGLGQILPKLQGRLKFKDLVVETLPPHGSRTFEIDAPSRAAADLTIKQSINIWADCLAKRQWPSYPKETAQVSTPSFHQQRAMERAYADE